MHIECKLKHLSLLPNIIWEYITHNWDDWKRILENTKMERERKNMKNIAALCIIIVLAKNTSY